MTETPKKPLTIRELIKKLEAFPNQELPVYTEGCDCTGDAVDVKKLDGIDGFLPERVLITR